MGSVERALSDQVSGSEWGGGVKQVSTTSTEQVRQVGEGGPHTHLTSPKTTLNAATACTPPSNKNPPWYCGTVLHSVA